MPPLTWDNSKIPPLAGTADELFKSPSDAFGISPGQSVFDGAVGGLYCVG